VTALDRADLRPGLPVRVTLSRPGCARTFVGVVRRLNATTVTVATPGDPRMRAYRAPYPGARTQRFVDGSEVTTTTTYEPAP
jgi:hypothetical protein